MIKISLVTPNYNYGHFIESTLRSVLGQNYPALEYVVMDDGSEDDSVAVIERYADQLACWESGPNRGQYAVLTEGFRKTTGEIMGWLNSDDLHCPWTLRVVGEIFETFPEVEWISTLRPVLWDYQGILIALDELPGFSREAFLDGSYFSSFAARPLEIQPSIPLLGTLQQESTFWRRSLWDKAGGYLSSDYGAAGDFELWARFFLHAEPYGVGVPLAGFRIQHTQQSAQRDKYRDECVKALFAARERSGWKADAMRNLAFRWNLQRPMRFFRRYSYTGKNILRTNPDRPDAGWKIAPCRFR